MGVDYFPKDDAGLVVWYGNFAAKVAAYGASVGVSAAEVAVAKNDSLMVRVVMNNIETIRTELAERVQYKRVMLNAPLGTPDTTSPLPPPLVTPDVVPTPGIIARTRALANRIKAHPAYSDAVGRDMGIVGGTGAGVPDAQAKPRLSATFDGGVVVVKFVKSGYDGVVLQAQRGDDTAWATVATPLFSPWRDRRPNAVSGAPEARRYRAMYQKKDVSVGQLSDVVTVIVG